MKQSKNYVDEYINELLCDIFTVHEIRDNYFPLHPINEVLIWERYGLLATKMHEFCPISYNMLRQDFECIMENKK